MLDKAHGRLAVGVTVVLLIAGTFYARRPKKNRKLPPGPSGVPLLGNLLQVPTKHMATYFRDLIQEYGGLASLNLAGSPVILIGDIKVAKELLERHAAKHSSRPEVLYLRYLDPTEHYWALFGKINSVARKLTAGVMSDVRAGKTEPLQEFEAVVNIQNLLNDGGQDWFHQMERIAASSVLSVGFGMHCPTGHEPDFKEVLGTISELLDLLVPTSTIINIFPFLDLIPGPMPWRTRAQLFRGREQAIFKRIIDEAVTGKRAGMNTWATAFARKDKPDGDQRHLLNQFAGVSTSLRTLVLACIRYPEWMETAQKEIDKVVGPDRLPSLKDRSFLPYVEAVVRETLRWRPALRLGLPHQATADDAVEYKGQQYFIPEGSFIFPVTWAMEHDQSIFEDHDRFMPERFLDADGTLKSNYETSAFGFGRRVCPGVPFAERTLWIAIATMLWTFNIHKSDTLDSKTGLPFKYDDGDAAFGGDLANSPLNFPAVFEPRSPERAEVARREWAECEKDLNVLLPDPKDT